MTQSIASVSTRLLTRRINEILSTKHSESYISRVKHDKAGAPALRRIVHLEEADMLRQAANTKLT